MRRGVMRRIKQHLLLHDGSLKIEDGLIREDPSLKRLYSAQVSVEVNPKLATNVEVFYNSA